MIISKEQAQELLRYFSNQFIDRNSKKLYDGEVLQQLLIDLNQYVSGQCMARHSDGFSICGMKKGHDDLHYDRMTTKSWQ